MRRAVMIARCLASAAAALVPRALPAAPSQTAPSQTAPSQSAPPQTIPAETVVNIDNFSFHADVVTVMRGATVTWTNRDDIPHTVTADGIPLSFRSHPLDTGDRFSMRFDRPGTYHYFCSLHPKMRGTVIVQ